MSHLVFAPQLGKDVVMHGDGAARVVHGAGQHGRVEHEPRGGHAQPVEVPLSEAAGVGRGLAQDVPLLRVVSQLQVGHLLVDFAMNIHFLDNYASILTLTDNLLDMKTIG